MFNNIADSRKKKKKQGQLLMEDEKGEPPIIYHKYGCTVRYRVFCIFQSVV